MLFFKNKKSSLELSITTIVIVVLAMTLLGLGLGFIRGMFKNIGGISEDVSAQVREKILDDLITGDKKVSFPKTEITIDKGKSEILTVGIRNKENDPLDYYINFNPKLDPDGNVLAGTAIAKWFKYAPANSGEAELIPPADYIVKNIKLDIPRGTNSGTYFLQFEVINSGVDASDPNRIYASKDIFIVVRG